MSKSADAFRTISEVSDWLETPTHVLRFWESKFAQIKPVKRAGGRRYYRPDDMRLLGGIKKLLHEDGMTIKGVQKILREKGVKEVAALSAPLEETDLAEAAEQATISSTVENVVTHADTGSHEPEAAKHALDLISEAPADPPASPETSDTPPGERDDPTRAAAHAAPPSPAVEQEKKPQTVAAKPGGTAPLFPLNPARNTPQPRTLSGLPGFIMEGMQKPPAKAAGERAQETAPTKPETQADAPPPAKPIDAELPVFLQRRPVARKSINAPSSEPRQPEVPAHAPIAQDRASDLADRIAAAISAAPVGAAPALPASPAAQLFRMSPGALATQGGKAFPIINRLRAHIARVS